MNISFPKGTSAPIDNSPPAAAPASGSRGESTSAPQVADGGESPPRRSSGLGSMSPLRRALPKTMSEALHSGDMAALGTMYDGIANGRTPVQVWRDAARANRYDMQHAVLLLHEGVDRQLTDLPREGLRHNEILLNGELHRPLTRQAHASLIDHIKQFPYYSEKPKRITLEDLNGKARFSDDSGTITCTDLSLAWVLQQEATGKPDYPALSHPASIQRHVPPGIGEHYHQIDQRAPEAHLLMTADWGGFLATQLGSLEASGGNASKRLLVSSHSHAMAIELKVKQGPEGPRYVANFYDPNLTATHKRAASGDLRRFEGMKLDDQMIVPELMQEYFGKEGIVLVVAVPPGGIDALPPVGDPQRRIASTVPRLGNDTMALLMSGAFVGNLRDLLPELVDMAKQDPAKAAHVLAATLDTGVPAFFAALQNGSASAVQAYTELVAAVPLDADTRFDLLSARTRKTRLVGLESALWLGRSDAVRAFVDGVAASGLPVDKQLDLLATKGARNDVPAPGLAMQEGELTTVHSYLDGITANASLHAGDKVALLSRPNSKGLTAMAFGLMHGTAGTVSALAEWVATQQDFSVDQQRKLLLAPDNDGTPALVQAFRQSEPAPAPDNIRAYVSAVLASPLSEADKIHLASAGLPPGALQHEASGPGATQALNAYREAVLGSPLSQSAKDLLLAGSDSTDKPRQA